jgi:membrane fusion protein (multidrug efflux system)
MLGFFKRYSFAAVVTVALALMAFVVVSKTLLAGDDAANASSPAPGAGRHGGGAPSVTTVAASNHAFSDAIQALGTAQARESIVLTPKVADTIRRLHFDSGQAVRQGQVLVEMSSVEQAADVAEARADDEAAQQNLRRTQELFNRGFASQAGLDTVQAAADAARARLNAGGSRINDRTIRAPFAGIVGLRTASPGQYVRPGDQIGTLDDTSEIKLDFDVPETQLSRVAAGVAIVGHTAAYPDLTFNGVIATVDSRVNPATRTVRVRAMLPNADGAIRPGMLMTVEIRSNPREALAVPEMAILDQADGAYVYRVRANASGVTSVDMARVQTGQRSGGMAEILSGLSVGDQVVTEGLQSVRPGQPVRVSGGQAAASAAPGAATSAPTLRPRG